MENPLKSKMFILFIVSILMILTPIIFCSTPYGCLNLGFNNPLYLLIYLLPLGLLMLVYILERSIKKSFGKIGRITIFIIATALFFGSIMTSMSVSSCSYHYDWETFFKCPESIAFITIISFFITVFVGFKKFEEDVSEDVQKVAVVNKFLKWLFVILAILLALFLLLAWMLSQMSPIF